MADITVRVQAVPGGPVSGVQVELRSEDMASIPGQTKVTGDGGSPGTAVFTNVQPGAYLVAITDYSLGELLGDRDNLPPEPSATGLAPRSNNIPVEVANNNSSERVRIALVEPRVIVPSTTDEKVRLVQEIMIAAALHLPVYVSTTSDLTGARRALGNLFCGPNSVLNILGNASVGEEVDTTPLADQALEKVQKVDQAQEGEQQPQDVDILARCATCTSLYTTPGTIYYRNYTWYQNCLYNPPCTP